MNGNLKLYAAIMGKHVPTAAYEALGDEAWNARALVVAPHKGLAMRAAEQAGVKVNLNGWRVANPQASELAFGSDVDLLQRTTRILFAPKSGDVLLSRRYAAGFVARWCPGVQRWTRVAEFVDGKALMLPGAVDEVLWDGDGDRWEVRAANWSARCVSVPRDPGAWTSLDIVQAVHGPLRRL